MPTTNPDHDDNFNARVSVYRPCRCAICERPGARWFQCPTADARFVKAYEGPGIDGTSFPTRGFIAAVRERHPEADLVYADHPAQR